MSPVFVLSLSAVIFHVPNSVFSSSLPVKNPLSFHFLIICRSSALPPIEPVANIPANHLWAGPEDSTPFGVIFSHFTPSLDDQTSLILSLLSVLACKSQPPICHNLFKNTATDP